MKKPAHHFLAFGLAITGFCSPVWSAPMRIVQQGKATCAIYLPTNATPSQVEAAGELVDYVENISGARLNIVHQADPKQALILIGPSEYVAKTFPKLNTQAASLKEDGFLIHSPAPETLVILGAGGEAVYFGVMALLESMGVRWYAPGAWGEEVPQSDSLSWDHGKPFIQEPGFVIRNIWLDGTNRDPDITGFRERHAGWARRLKGSKKSPVISGHHFAKILPKETYFEEHPEYYSLRSGQRQATHLCMSNPEVLELASQGAIDILRKDTRYDGVGLAMTDGLQWCECSNCMARYSGQNYPLVAKHYIFRNPDVPAISDLYVPFLDGIGRKLEEAFPERELKCGFYVYSTLLFPPSLPENKKPLHRFIYPMIAPLLLCPLHSGSDEACWMSGILREVVDGYTDISDNVLFREYDPHLSMTQEMPLPMLSRIREDLPYLHQRGVIGFQTQGRGSAYVSSGLNYYLRYKMMWDPTQDFDALLEDYFTGMYGPAASAVRQYITAFSEMIDACPIHFSREDNLIPEMYPLEKIEALSPLIKEAQALVATSPERYKVRVGMLALAQENSLAFLRMDAASRDGDFPTAVQQAKELMAVRERAKAQNPDWMATRRYAQRSWFAEERINKFEEYQSRIDGNEGTLITWLPREWSFKHNSGGLGMTLGWASTPVDETWTPQLTDKMWQRRFEELSGYSWWKTSFTLEANQADQDLELQLPGVFSDLWVFLNGDLVAYRRPFTGWNRNWDWPYACTLPAHLLLSGENQLTIRSSSSIGAIGTFKRPFIYQAVEKNHD